MKTRNYYLLIAGIICLFTALLHTLAGQIDLVEPMMTSSLQEQTKTELLGVWHMVTVVIFVAAYILLRNGWKPRENQGALLKGIAYLFLAFGGVFIGVSLFRGVLAPQWILCLPIGGLALRGI